MGYVTDKFSKRLKEIRETAGLTQEQLANELNVSRGAISYYEKGSRTPDIEFLDSLSEYFDLPFDFLMGYTDNVKEVHRNMYEFYGLTDGACEELDRNPEIGHLISTILESEDFFPLKRLLQGYIKNYNTFNYNQLGYISFLITDVLSKIIRDSLRVLLDMQLTPEERSSLELEVENTEKRLEELEKLLKEQQAQIEKRIESDIKIMEQDEKENAIRYSSIEKVRNKFYSTVHPSELHRK